MNKRKTVRTNKDIFILYYRMCFLLLVDFSKL